MFTEFTKPLGQSQPRFVIAGLTRNPGLVWHWIPDVETPDPGSSPGQALIRGRDDKPPTLGLIGVRHDKMLARA